MPITYEKQKQYTAANPVKWSTYYRDKQKEYYHSRPELRDKKARMYAAKRAFAEYRNILIDE